MAGVDLTISMTNSRKLAVIMFTDIVGYTALMGSNEDKALEILRASRKIHTDLIGQYQGALIKEMGDGNLIQFGSAADAVQCAIEIQRRAGIELDAQIRIGIHLGDVTVEHKDVFGDGVNIASRLQSIADPGGIYISESVQKSIRAKRNLETTYLGGLRLKNVDYPVATYAIVGADLPIPEKRKINDLIYSGKKRPILKSVEAYFLLFLILITVLFWYRDRLPWGEDHISSLVFLPFDNYTGSDTLEYMMAGMHDALIGEVGKIGSLRVPGTKTANAYKGAEKSIPEIASELQVDAGVETSVSCYGEQICFQVKVVSAFPEERQIWVKDYQVERSQIQNWYKALVKEISQEISVNLTPGEETLLSSEDPVDPVAYDLYMRGQFYLDQTNYVSLQRAEEYFNLAIKTDPAWAAPYAGLAEVGSYQKQMGFISPEVVLPKIQKNLDIALGLDSNSINSHYVKAVVAVWTEFDWVKGEREFLRTLTLNPNHVRARIFYAHLLAILRRTEESLHHGGLAEALDPLNPLTQGLYAALLNNAGNCEGAIEHAEKGLAIEPDHYFTRMQFMNASECLGDSMTAFEMWKQTALPRWEKFGVTELLDSVFRTQGWLAVNNEAIRLHEGTKQGLLILSGLADRCLLVDQKEKAFDSYEKMYELRNPNIPYLSGNYYYKQLKDHPRYVSLLKKMNLPVN